VAEGSLSRLPACRCLSVRYERRAELLRRQLDLTCVLLCWRLLSSSWQSAGSLYDGLRRLTW